MSRAALYDRIGHAYATGRRTDPRIARRLWSALGDARSVLNVGAGTGSYAPPDRDVVAIEPSAVMRAQRPAGASACIAAAAEALPFPDASFDAVMAVFSDHHWPNRAAGLREVRRVARNRVVLLNADPSVMSRYWLSVEYLTGFLDLYPSPLRSTRAWKTDLEQHLGPVSLEVVPIPHDCRDGFYAAYWRRPHAYLDPGVRNNISVFARLPRRHVEQAIAQLARDLERDAWQQRHAGLLRLEQLDVGCRVIVAELEPKSAAWESSADD
jgi:SAM-dependent methyltransferase